MSKRTPLRRSTHYNVLLRDNFRCRYCGRHSSEVELQVDHIHPVSKGGTNDLSNLCAACIDCNLGKAAVDIFAIDGFDRMTEVGRLEALTDVSCRRFPNAKPFYAKELLNDARACDVSWELLVELCTTVDGWWDLAKSVYWIAGCHLDSGSALALVRRAFLRDANVTRSEPAVAQNVEQESADYQEEIRRLGEAFFQRLRARGLK